MRETLRDCLTEAMDIEGLRALLGRMDRGELRLIARDTAEPSPLSHEILNSAPYAYLDDAPLEERRSRAVQLRRTLDPADAASLGALDSEAIAEVVSQASPDLRSADELHDLLLTLVLLPAAEAGRWLPWLEELRAADRAVLRDGFWRAAERSGAELLDAVRGWVGITGPVTAAELAGKLGVASVEAELALLENDGLVLRGRYREGATETEWCERTLLSRIHGLTLGRLRREIEPATTQDFFRFLFRWQHVHARNAAARSAGAVGSDRAAAGVPGGGLGVGERGAGCASRALRQGAARPALLSGEIAWGRLACADESARRMPPGRATPIALVRREDLPWLLDATRGGTEPLGRSGAAPAGAARAARRALSARAARRHRAPGARAERSALGAGLGRSRHLRRVRRAARACSRASRARRGAGRSCGRTRRSNASREWLEKLGRQYLRRYGVVFRDLLAREPRSPPWRELLQIYRRLEARGEIPRRPVRAGLLRRAVRAARGGGRAARGAEAPDGRRGARSLSACDPLNLVGILTPGARVPACSRTASRSWTASRKTAQRSAPPEATRSCAPRQDVSRFKLRGTSRAQLESADIEGSRSAGLLLWPADPNGTRRGLGAAVRSLAG